MPFTPSKSGSILRNLWPVVAWRLHWPPRTEGKEPPMSKPLRPRRRLLVEPLEDRSLPAATVASALRNGLLTITGSETADMIVVRQTGAGAVTLIANGVRHDYRGVGQVSVD